MMKETVKSTGEVDFAVFFCVVGERMKRNYCSEKMELVARCGKLGFIV